MNILTFNINYTLLLLKNNIILYLKLSKKDEKKIGRE